MLLWLPTDTCALLRTPPSSALYAASLGSRWCLSMPPDKGKRPYEWDTIPGPGAYTISSNQKGEGVMGAAPSFSMVGRKPVPGPSHSSPGPVYSPRSKAQMGDGSSYTFGSSRDPGRLGGGGTKASGSKAPGPGDYDTHTTAKGASSLGDSPRYGFGTASQRESHSARGRRCVRPAEPTRHTRFSSSGREQRMSRPLRTSALLHAAAPAPGGLTPCARSAVRRSSHSAAVSKEVGIGVKEDYYTATRSYQTAPPDRHAGPPHPTQGARCTPMMPLTYSPPMLRRQVHLAPARAGLLLYLLTTHASTPKPNPNPNQVHLAPARAGEQLRRRLARPDGLPDAG